MAVAWKELERQVAKRLGGKRRLSRSMDFGFKDFDVEIPDFPHFKLDCKYRSQPFKHHGMLTAVRKLYCGEGDVALLITKNRHEKSAVVSLSLDDFAGILTALRAVRPMVRGDGEES